MLICPLCLHEVRPGAEFHVFCAQHPADRPAVPYQGDEADLGRLRCATSPLCASTQSLWEGVFLAHNGCLAKNPFWDGASVVTTGNATQLEIPGPPQRFVEPDDPQLSVLKRIGAHYPKTQEMWFPLSLFRAVNESAYGQMVMLTGPRQVGKTIIAMMAMNPDTYVGGTTSSCTPEAFVSLYSLDGTGVVRTSYLEVLHILTQLRRSQPADGPVPPTGQSDVHVKTVFLASHPKRSRRQLAWSIVKQSFDLMFKNEPVAPGTVHPTIAFFDLGGERFWDSKVPDVARWTNGVSVIAAVIEAPGLMKFGRRPGPDTDATPDSVRRATERLNLVPSDKRRCVVVTKADLIPEANHYLTSLGDGVTEPEGQDARELFLSWLDSRAANERALAALLSHDPSIPVFIIGTYNLDGGRLGKGGQMPHSAGLRRFLQWILDKR